jgi:hypothetical protein
MSNDDPSVKLPTEPVSTIPYRSGQTYRQRRPFLGRFEPAWPVMLAAATVAGGFFVLVAGTLTPTLGGTRSCKLKWQQRLPEINQAIPASTPDVNSVPKTI